MKPRKRLPISRACLFAAAALLSVAPRARAANVFFDADGATTTQLGAATVGAAGTWSDAFWYDAATATTATGNEAVANYTFTAADTAYFQGNKGTLTAAADQTITLNGINDSTGMTLSGGSLSLSGAGANITVNGSLITTVVSSQITGADGLIKAGTGTLTPPGTPRAGASRAEKLSPSPATSSMTLPTSSSRVALQPANKTSNTTAACSEDERTNARKEVELTASALMRRRGRRPRCSLRLEVELHAREPGALHLVDEVGETHALVLVFLGKMLQYLVLVFNPVVMLLELESQH